MVFAVLPPLVSLSHTLCERQLTMATRPLFKKKKKKSKNLRQTSHGGDTDSKDDKNTKKRESLSKNDSEDDDDEDDAGVSMAIRQTVKKRKLIQSTVYRKGIDAATALQASTKRMDTQDEKADKGSVGTGEEPQERDLESRLKGTFSGGTGTVSSSDGVLQRKHKQAMEEYVQSQMNSGDGESKAPVGSNSDKDKSTVPENVDAEAKLYRELAESARRMAGELPEAGAAGSAEDDVGAGGAVLGGTGIAEVILPVDERVAAAKAAQLAERQVEERRRGGRQSHRSREQQRRQQSSTSSSAAPVDYSSLPMSFNVGMAKRKRKEKEGQGQTGKGWQVGDKQQKETKTVDSYSASSAGAEVLRRDVSAVASSFSHNYRQHARERGQAFEKREKTLRRQAGGDSDANESAFDAADGDRAGFAASRAPSKENGEAKPKSDGPRFQQRASDDKVWRSFIKRARQRNR